MSAEFSRSQSDGDEYVGLAVLIRDTTEEDEFCSHMLRIERLAVLGELASAMAHEINSPLGGVMESLRIIQKNLGNAEKTDRFLSLAHRGLEQIRATVGQMLTFATPAEEPCKRLVLETVVEQCVDFLRCREGELNVELDLKLCTEQTQVVVDEHALCQALINIINNGLDAVAGRPGGRVEVTTRLLPATGEVVVRVSDNGPGVPSNLRARVFDPFFTTKPSGKGTGLGLSISARIASRHGGRIVLSDSAEGGAAFALVLPLLGRLEEGRDDDRET
jgi:C4-dicarboxylate-specific signal transduction histidine kinase